jgi:hypothetical protein
VIGLEKLNEASKLLEQIDVKATSQLAGDPDWGAGVSLLRAQIEYRRKDYDSARKDVEAVTPVFTRKDAEPYQRHALESLTAELAKVPQRN